MEPFAHKLYRIGEASLDYAPKLSSFVSKGMVVAGGFYVGVGIGEPNFYLSALGVVMIGSGITLESSRRAVISDRKRKSKGLDDRLRNLNVHSN